MPFLMMDIGVIVFILFWVLVTGIILTIFYKRGKSVLSSFPPIVSVNVKYRDRLARGHLISRTSGKFSNTDKSLNVIVTDDEFWVTCSPFIARTVQNQGLIHKISKENVKQVVVKEKRVEVSFVTSDGQKNKISLDTHSPELLVKSIRYMK